MESRKNQGKHEEKDMGEILSKAEQFFEKHAGAGEAAAGWRAWAPGRAALARDQNAAMDAACRRIGCRNDQPIDYEIGRASCRERV